MPVRIYEIAKKLGIENKEVLAKAKELGISAARVPSSSLDKITAEFLESQIQALLPKPVEPAPPPPAPEPVLIVAPPVEPVPEPVQEASPVPAAEVAVAPLEAGPGPVLITAPVAEAIAPPPAPPAPPAPPPAPRVGDLVGRITLPPRPGARPPVQPERGAPAARGPQRPGQPSRNEPPRGGRMDQRGMRPAMPGPAPARPATPAEPRFVPPTTGELIIIKPPVIVRELAEKLGRKPFQLIADLIELKVLANVNQAIDEVVAQKLCAKYGFRFEVEKRERGGGQIHTHVKKIELDQEDKTEELKPRAPVVTIMGHVDHGKTTLLDVIRKSDVAGGEAGGITQHIGAYTIQYPHPDNKDDLRQITFLDTPGHAAFSAMRARGANVTDLVVLVVAANDGVMPQTVEALNHARAARVPIIVAVNKIDHPNANSMKVRQQLQEKGVVPDDWGGDTTFVEVSALTKKGIDQLLGIILLQSDLMELKANPTRRAKGNVIESGLAPGGPTATVLVRKGTLRVGDIILCGEYYGKVRALINEENQRLKEAIPSVAVRVLGLNGVPEAGIEFTVVEDERTARDLAEERTVESKAQSGETRAKATLESIFQTLAESSAKVLKLVVKADTQGSVEAIVEALHKIESEGVSLEVIHSAVGTVNESDAILASASNAVVLGFHTRIDGGAAEAAKRENVQIKLYSIIYELVDQVKEAMAGLLDPVIKETIIGVAEVRKLFELSKGGTVAGCAIASGRLLRGKARVMRRKNLVYEGPILSLRRFQDEVNEVRAGMECGIRIDGFDEFQIGDTIESFSIEKVAAKL